MEAAVLRRHSDGKGAEASPGVGGGPPQLLFETPQTPAAYSSPW